MEGVQKIVIRGGGANFSAVFSQMSANNPAEIEDYNLENYDEMFILHKFYVNKNVMFILAKIIHLPCTLWLSSTSGVATWGTLGHVP